MNPLWILNAVCKLANSSASSLSGSQTFSKRLGIIISDKLAGEKKTDSKTYSPPPSLAKLICHAIDSETYPRQGWIRVPVVKVTQTFVLCSLKFRKSIKMFWIQTFSFLGVPDFRVYYMLQVWCACLFGRSFVCQQPSVEEESGREDNRLSPFNSTWLCCIPSPGR